MCTASHGPLDWGRLGLRKFRSLSSSWRWRWSSGRKLKQNKNRWNKIKIQILYNSNEFFLFGWIENVFFYFSENAKFRIIVKKLGENSSNISKFCFRIFEIFCWFSWKGFAFSQNSSSQISPKLLAKTNKRIIFVKVFAQIFAKIVQTFSFLQIISRKYLTLCVFLENTQI